MATETKKSHKRTWAPPIKNDKEKIEKALNEIRFKAQNFEFKTPLLSHSSFLTYLNIYYKIHTSKTYLATNFYELMNECIELYDDFIQTIMPAEQLFNLWRTRYNCRNNMNTYHLNRQLEELQNQQTTKTEVVISIEDKAMKRVK